MGWRRIEQGIETQTLEIQPTTCLVCRKSLYRNVTFLTGGWARCSQCNEVVHYACLSGGKFLKDRPRFCADCKAGRVRSFQTMPVPPNQACSTRSAPDVRDGITPPATSDPPPASSVPGVPPAPPSSPPPSAPPA